MCWTKPAGNYYPSGFTNLVVTSGARYIVTPNQRVLDMTNGGISFSDGNLGSPFTNIVVMTEKNLFQNMSTNALCFKLTVANSLFSGTVKIPGTKITRTFKGVLLQDHNEGYGYFLGDD